MSKEDLHITASDGGSGRLLEGITAAVEASNPGGRIIVAGPCSAETRRQVMDTARGLSPVGIDVFRAGIWKPRTRPGGFEGCGSRGLEWLREVKESFGMRVATEIATPRHAELALKSGVDVLWLGARTTTNPFAVQEIAEVLKGEDVAVMVKNPANPDLELWIGAMQRLYMAGVRRLTAVHRGFGVYGPSLYRNPPLWEIPIELHRRFPQLQMLCDPSHIGGKRSLIEPLANHAFELGFDGLIVECHCNPQVALSDAAQQVTPARLAEILECIGRCSAGNPDEALSECRRKIDDIDNQLLELLARRMAVSDEIGELKKVNNMPVLQPTRYEALMRSRVDQAEALGLDRRFTMKVLSAIHAESVNRQLKLKS